MTDRSLTRVIAFASGKGGTGKTTVVLNLATALATNGRRVLVMDADLGLANIDVMVGLRPKATLHDLVRGTATLEDIILETPDGVSILPAASGVAEMCELTTEARYMLLQEVERIAAHFDYLLIDTQAGIGQDVQFFCSAASETTVVITPDPASITDAYALMKVLAERSDEKGFSVIVNDVSAPPEASLEAVAMHAYTRLRRSAERFLHVSVEFIGAIPADNHVREAHVRQQALVSQFPSAAASRAIRALSLVIDERFLARRTKGGVQFFFRELLG